LAALIISGRDFFANKKNTYVKTCRKIHLAQGVLSVQSNVGAEMDKIHIMKKLNKLKLQGMTDTLEHRLEQALTEKWPYSTLLDMLLTDEVERRNNRQLVLRLAKSRLDQCKTMETFKFDFNPNIQAALIRELSLCAFVEKKQNLFILGQSGVGKSHLAHALGHEACRREWDVLCYGTYQLFRAWRWVSKKASCTGHQDSTIDFG